MMQLKLRRSVVQGTSKQLHPTTALRAQDSDRSQSEVRCTHGGQPNKLVQSASENDSMDGPVGLSKTFVCEQSSHANGLTYFKLRFLNRPQKAQNV